MKYMNYLTEDQLRKLNAQRRKSLLKRVYARIGQWVAAGSLYYVHERIWNRIKFGKK